MVAKAFAVMLRNINMLSKTYPHTHHSNWADTTCAVILSP